jgi:hypothetical protein
VHYPLESRSVYRQLLLVLNLNLSEILPGSIPVGKWKSMNPFPQNSLNHVQIVDLTLPASILFPSH